MSKAQGKFDFSVHHPFNNHWLLAKAWIAFGFLDYFYDGWMNTLFNVLTML